MDDPYDWLPTFLERVPVVLQPLIVAVAGAVPYLEPDGNGRGAETRLSQLPSERDGDKGARRRPEHADRLAVSMVGRASGPRMPWHRPFRRSGLGSITGTTTCRSSTTTRGTRT